MDIKKYKEHSSWPILKDLYITDEIIKDFEEHTRNSGMNEKYRMIFQIEGDKWNRWIFQNLIWYVEFVRIEYLGINPDGVCEAIPGDPETINKMLRNSPAVLARLHVCYCEVDEIYKKLSSIIWRACPSVMTIEDKRAEKYFYTVHMRAVREKLGKAVEDIIERIQVLKKVQVEALSIYRVSNNAEIAAQPKRNT